MFFKFLASFVQQLSGDVSFLVDGAYTILYWVLRLNYNLVRVLVEGAQVQLEPLKTVLDGVRFALHCGVEDFASFVKDLFGMLIEATDLMTSGIMQMWNAYVGACSFVGGLVVTCGLLIRYCLQLILGSIYSLILYVTSVLCLTVGAIGLMLDAVIAAAAFLPKSALRTVVAIKTGLLCLGGHLIDGCNLLLLAISSSYLKTVEVVHGIPKDTYLGIAVLCVLYYLSRRLALTPRTSANLWRQFCRRASHLLTVWRRPVPAAPTSHATGYVAFESSTESEEEEESSPSTSAATAANDSEIVSRLQKRLEEVQDSTLCVICHDMEKCVALLPCRHLCLCRRCTARIVDHDPQCPICRTFIVDVLRVYS